jgi:hypothetical protein
VVFPQDDARFTPLEVLSRHATALKTWDHLTQMALRVKASLGAESPAQYYLDVATRRFRWFDEAKFLIELVFAVGRNPLDVPIKDSWVQLVDAVAFDLWDPLWPHRPVETIDPVRKTPISKRRRSLR